MAFPPEFLDELRTRIATAEVVGKRVRLIRRGPNLIGLCPFHKEKTPSFHVYDDHYHCFGCGEHGGALDFVMKTEGLTFPEAVERLAALAGMPVPENSPEDRARAEARSSLHDAMEAACRFFERTLRMPEGRAGLDYLRRRGLDDAAAKRFRLGYAPDSRGALKAALARDGFDDARLLEAGLLVAPEDSSRPPYDRFRGRVIFPIEDRRGRVIAFGGRILASGEPKYLNSPETPLFHKGATLYNISRAAPAARKAGTIIVCEGYMDVIALDGAGFGHAVAPLGTALGARQIEDLWRIAAEPVMCFDGDAAGWKAALKAAETALTVIRPGVGARFALLSDGEDPDSLIRKAGPGAMAEVLERAERLSEVLWRAEVAANPPTSPEGRAALQARLEEHARRIGDPTFRGFFLKWAKERVWKEGDGAPPSAPGRRGRGADRGRSRRGAGPEPLRDVVPPAEARRHADPRAIQEGLLLAALVTHPDLYDTAGERLGMLGFAESRLDNLRQEVLKTLAAESALDSPGLQRHLCEHGFSEELKALLSGSFLFHGAFAKPGTPIEDARAGWEQTYAMLLRKVLETEVSGARREFEADMTSETFHRVSALRLQHQTTHLTDEADGDPDTRGRREPD